MKKRSYKKSNTEQSETNTDIISKSIGSLGGFNLLSGAITTNTCSTEDDSFYCKLSRGYNSVSMIVNLMIMFFAFCSVVFFLYRFFLNRKISKKR